MKVYKSIINKTFRQTFLVEADEEYDVEGIIEGGDGFLISGDDCENDFDRIEVESTTEASEEDILNAIGRGMHIEDEELLEQYKFNIALKSLRTQLTKIEGLTRGNIEIIISLVDSLRRAEKAKAGVDTE